MDDARTRWGSATKVRRGASAEEFPRRRPAKTAANPASEAGPGKMGSVGDRQAGRTEKLGEMTCPAGRYARMPLTGCGHSSTPVRRTSSPWNLYVRRLWSIPMQCRIVAFMSWMWTGFSTML